VDRHRKRNKAVAREQRLMRIAGKGAAGAAVGAAGPGVASGAATGLLAGAALEIWDWLMDRVRESRAGRSQKLLLQLSSQHASDVGQALRSVKAALEEEPLFADAVVETFRQLDHSLDDAVVPSLALLVAEYRTKPVDWFFRSVGRLLADLVPGELEALHTIVEAARRVRAPRRKFLLLPRSDGGLTARFYKADEDFFLAQELSCKVADPRRLFFLLNSHGLALGPEDGGVVLEEAVVERLAKIVQL